MNAVVFAGPTIPADEIRAIVDAVCLPPVAHGDVYRVSLERPRAIGIIDGYFERQPAVWHKEILWALNEGIHVFGSASMGALRAAELAPFGMVGVKPIALATSARTVARAHNCCHVSPVRRSTAAGSESNT
jgi:hypothetical protein